MALKNLLNALKSDTVLVGEIDNYLLRKANTGSGFVKDDRAKGVWHPSEIMNCPRALVFEKSGVKEKADSVSPVTQRIFDVGHHYGYMIQEYLYGMGILYGEWRCRKCEHRWLDMFENPSPRVCPECGEELWIWNNLDYLEVPVRIDHMNIEGHADGLVKTLGKFRVVESKSIKNRTAATSKIAVTYDDLSQPKEEHQCQLNLYIHAINEEAKKVGLSVEHGVFLYGAKNDQGIKEFPVKLLYDTFVAPQFDKIRNMEACLKTGVLPVRPVGCDSKSSYGCRFCGFNEICYTSESLVIANFVK